MLKFLTHKLKTHSLNEENTHQKVEDDDHDSGTESDDEHADTEEPETSMDSSETEVDMCAGASTGLHQYHATAGTVSPYFIDSALPSDSDLNYDHHSSEEELEVINSSCCSSQPSPTQLHHHQNDLVTATTTMTIITTQMDTIANKRQLQPQLRTNNDVAHQHHLSHNHQRYHSPLNNNNISSNNSTDVEVSGGPLIIARSRSASTLPEKRKWSQVTLETSSASTGPRAIQVSDDSSSSGRTSSQHIFTSCVAIGRSDLSSGSSDEEVQGLLATPVQFRTSPPRGAHRPGRSFSPPPKLFHYATGQDSSPRKRHRHATPHAIQRPCLDFEKMQQLKARAVTAWRHSGDHGGELSVFCW